MVEAVASQRRPSTQELLSVVTLCIGVALATVTDKRVTANLTGLGSAVAAVCLTVAYQATHHATYDPKFFWLTALSKHI